MSDEVIVLNERRGVTFAFGHRGPKIVITVTDNKAGVRITATATADELAELGARALDAAVREDLLEAERKKGKRREETESEE